LTIQENSIENNYNNCFKLYFGESNLKKKLFAKKEYPMFNYDMKKKITDYGIVKNKTFINHFRKFLKRN